MKIIKSQQPKKCIFHLEYFDYAFGFMSQSLTKKTLKINIQKTLSSMKHIN